MSRYKGAHTYAHTTHAYFLRADAADECGTGVIAGRLHFLKQTTLGVQSPRLLH